MSIENVVATLSLEETLSEAMSTTEIGVAVPFNSGMAGHTNEQWLKAEWNAEKPCVVDGYATDLDMVVSLLATAKLHKIDLKGFFTLDDGKHIVAVVKKVQLSHLTLLVEQRLVVRSVAWVATKRAINTQAEPVGQIVAKKVTLNW
jgi:hypothetical protein